MILWDDVIIPLGNLFCQINYVSEFPAFQEMLQQKNFPFLVLKLCLEDPESFVRASALKCLQEMIQSPVLWNEFFEKQDLTVKIIFTPQKFIFHNYSFQEKAIQILSSESEGIIRLEAVALIHCLYLHESVAQEKMEQLYEIMVAAVTVDLHWKVKRKALEFWDTVIWERLRNQGMIDGKFPDVTFSIENRKIVKLNDNEIKRRLNKVLMELSANGCLTVLTKAIEEDQDIEVIEKAVDVTKKFAALLDKYKIKDKLPIQTPSSASLCQNDCFDFSVHVEKEKVEEFLVFIQEDLDKVLENRRKFLRNANGLSALFDKMLRDYEEDDEGVNTMECYC